MALGRQIPGHRDLSLGPITTPPHRVRRERCDAAETARAARLARRHLWKYARRVAIEAAEAAGAMLRESAGRLRVRPKGDSGDVVTDLDLAIEAVLINRVLGAFPTHRVIAEESGVHGSGEWTWLIDPLDGTNNIAIGLHAYVVGLALCRGGRPVVGVVHDPVRGHTWSAVRDAGALGPTGPLTGPPRRDLPHGPVLAWTQGHGVPRQDSQVRALKMTMELRARRVLQLWAPLLSWAMLARGDIDGMIGYQAEALDLPAGALIAQEAGLEIRGLDGGPFEADVDAPPEARSFIAAAPALIEPLLAIVAEAKSLADALPRA
ncbi:inositol monophosphatase family protein [Thermobispora bispora]|uniref:Inositol-phosphate phosphatase n=1 Tax=Thermobispora bispora (strain ATCC 19993 / DSM 43833 / CBS 139.67 / JCM 10125 / KCTC 9307 / NBRC 14880 / R51) TaxID=469371 RepID=D6YA56_THEBD|nr:Inositol-phosphate phosphatase [Thermobispora bispora DSM 43833]